MHVQFPCETGLRPMTFPSDCLKKLLAYALFLSFIHIASPRISNTSCWPGLDGRRCVQRTQDGLFCYVGIAGQASESDCKGASADFAGVLAAHNAQHLSMAYYDGQNRPFPGGIDFEVPGDGRVVRLCLSGLAGNGELQTACANVDKDNQLWSGTGPTCLVLGGPVEVSDGCYADEQVMTPRRGLPTTITTTRSSSSARSSRSTSTTSSQSSTSTSSQPPTSLTTNGSPATSTVETITATATTTTHVLPSNTNIATSPLPTPSNVSVAKDIVVPIIGSVLGFLGALFGAGFWRRRQALARGQPNPPLFC